MIIRVYYCLSSIVGFFVFNLNIELYLRWLGLVYELWMSKGSSDFRVTPVYRRISTVTSSTLNQNVHSTSSYRKVCIYCSDPTWMRLLIMSLRQEIHSFLIKTTLKGNAHLCYMPAVFIYASTHCRSVFSS